MGGSGRLSGGSELEESFITLWSPCHRRSSNLTLESPLGLLIWAEPQVKCTFVFMVPYLVHPFSIWKIPTYSSWLSPVSLLVQPNFLLCINFMLGTVLGPDEATVQNTQSFWLPTADILAEELGAKQVDP